MATIDHGCLGNRHGEIGFGELCMSTSDKEYIETDFDGSCQQLRWTTCDSSLFGRCRYVETCPVLQCSSRYLSLIATIEAGLYPGVAYYITLWYPRHRAQFRQAMFFSAASVAGAFSGLLAYAIAVGTFRSSHRLSPC
jgi:hypothetical protein